MDPRHSQPLSAEEAAKTPFRRTRLFIANGFGSGLAPKAPGTFGTMGAVLFFLPLAPMAVAHPILYLVMVTGFTMVAVWAADGAEAHYRRHDVGNIVCDEFIGFLITMTMIPANWRTVLVAFVVFRFLDIVKIPPAKQIDRGWPGGWGVVLDDVVSGVYANVVMQVLIRLAPALMGLAVPA